MIVYIIIVYVNFNSFLKYVKTCFVYFVCFNDFMNNLAVDLLKNVPALDKRYTTSEMRKKAVVVLGSSKTTEPLMKYMDLCSETTKAFVQSGFNIVTGCGTKGIMGSAYYAAKSASAVDLSGKPVQNLAIVVDPLWGDENLEECVLIGKASSESERIMKFAKVADNFVIFPGGVTTLQEAATLIRHNVHSSESMLKKIVLVGKDFFAGLRQQYKALADLKLIKNDPDAYFRIISEKNEILKTIFKK